LISFLLTENNKYTLEAVVSTFLGYTYQYFAKRI